MKIVSPSKVKNERVFPQKNPLMLAGEQGDKLTVKSHLFKGAVPFKKDNLGRTALSYAAEQSHLEIVELLESERLRIEYYE